MRKKLLYEGARKLEYEIRYIVKKAELVEKCGQPIYWENIGDPIQKHAKVPDWIKEIIGDLVKEDETYGYCHSQGDPAARAFVAKQNNLLKGAQVSDDDVLFFNGLGDAISKLYRYLPPTSRVIGPSPTYSTHSSTEAAHANSEPLTYYLDPDNYWYPDLNDLYNKVKYNPNIAGILIINPDNPTGMVYPPEYLEKIVAIARKFDLLLISDEIYTNIIYNGASTLRLSQIVGDLPGIALKGISKELPWPGARCGWMEFYNRHLHPGFNDFCTALEDAKMVEVCSTTLPQKALPQILGDPRYEAYVAAKNKAIGERSRMISGILGDVEQIRFVPTQGAFYNTMVFKEGALRPGQFLKTDNPGIQALLDDWITDQTPLDKRFVYYLLATTGVCVVPLSSFHSDLHGFRVTLLEENTELLQLTFNKIKSAIREYCQSDMIKV